MKIAVIGSEGQLGVELMKDGERRGWSMLGLAHGDSFHPEERLIEIELFASVDAALTTCWYKGNGLDAVINTAAYHDMRKCKEHPIRA